MTQSNYECLIANIITLCLLAKKIGIDNRLKQFLRVTKMDKIYPLSSFKSLNLNFPENSHLSPNRGLGRLLRPKYSILGKLSKLISRCIEDVWNTYSNTIQVTIGTCQLNTSIWMCLLKRLISPTMLIHKIKIINNLIERKYVDNPHIFQNKFYVIQHKTNYKLIDISHIRLIRKRKKFSRSFMSNLLLTKTNPYIQGINQGLINL